jgi:hypothetical protein
MDRGRYREWMSAEELGIKKRILVTGCIENEFRVPRVRIAAKQVAKDAARE